MPFVEKVVSFKKVNTLWHLSTGNAYTGICRSTDRGKTPNQGNENPCEASLEVFLLKINKADVSSIKRQESLKNYQDLTVIQIKPNISEIEPKLRNQENNCLFTEKTLQNRSEHLSNDYWARCYLEKKNNSKDALI